MTWRDDITESQQERLRQIERYQELYGFSPDSDLFLLCEIAEIADTKEWLAIQRGDIDGFLQENGYDPDKLKVSFEDIARKKLEQ